MGDILHKDLSFRVVGLAQKVHRALGLGFPEAIYQRALRSELLAAGIPFETEKKVEVWYGDALCGEFRLDLLVDGKIILELKSLEEIVDGHLAQALSYLKATGLRLAILMNFGAQTLQCKRVVR